MLISQVTPSLHWLFPRQKKGIMRSLTSYDQIFPNRYLMKTDSAYRLSCLIFIPRMYKDKPTCQRPKNDTVLGRSRGEPAGPGVSALERCFFYIQVSFSA